MSIKRRDFLLLMGGSTGALVLGSLGACDPKSINQSTAPLVNSPFAFKSILGPIPLETSGVSPQDQQEKYSSYEVVDDLLLPEGFQYQVVATWGDKDILQLTLNT